MKILDLPDWPPEPGGSLPSSQRSPSSGQAILKRIEGSNGSVVTFVCEFDGTEHIYDFETYSFETVEKLEKVLWSNLGKSITEIGLLDISD